ncbi:cell surface glycoprotein 1 [Latimeria chalumnae]|uniref:cell surface glycoprotein 1 n=1 Tax=Latimeria chalumnae TaxID=7897 RepID=UPI00313F35DF
MADSRTFSRPSSPWEFWNPWTRPRQIYGQDFGLPPFPEELDVDWTAWARSRLSSAWPGYFQPALGVRPEEQPSQEQQVLQHQLSGGVSEIGLGPNSWKVCLDVKHFSPEEIAVKTKEGFLEISGKHDERPDPHGLISRCFKRRYKVPSEVDQQSITSSLSHDGVLTVESPLLRPVAQPSMEIVIPVQIESKTEPHREEEVAEEHEDIKEKQGESQTGILENLKQPKQEELIEKKKPIQLEDVQPLEGGETIEPDHGGREAPQVTKETNPVGQENPKEEAQQDEPKETQPVEAIKESEDTEPVGTIKGPEEPQPVDNPKELEGIQLAEASKEESEETQPTKVPKDPGEGELVKITKESEEVQPTEITKESEETKPTEITKESEETKPTEITKESEETKPTEITSESKKTKPTEITKESEGTQTIEVTSESEETNPTEITKESEETKPTEITSESEETKPTEITKESEETKPTEITSESEETKPTEITKESEETQTTEITKETPTEITSESEETKPIEITKESEIPPSETTRSSEEAEHTETTGDTEEATSIEQEPPKELDEAQATVQQTLETLDTQTLKKLVA